MFSRNFVFLAAVAVSFPALAQSPAVSGPSQPGRDASRIAAINERIAVMSAELAELEMQAKISAKRSEIDKASETSRAFAMEESFIPSVKEISGIDGRVWAVLNVMGGNTQTVRVGDRVGGWRVVQILPDSVTVKRGNDTIHLSFGFSAPQPQAAGQGGQVGQGGLPPFPVR